MKLAEKVAGVRHGYFSLFERDVLRSGRFEMFVSALDFGGSTIGGGGRVVGCL